jgi:protein-S-isoprenylcysteine O-methyltransferase Ste14
MLLLRIYLLGGLLVHKAVWEILKRRQRGCLSAKESTSSKLKKPAAGGLPVEAVKAVKIAILLAIAAQTLLPDILPISGEPLVLRIAGTLIYTAGLLIAIRGRTELGGNWSDIESAQVLREQAVVSNGPYRLIRHPIYVGDLMLLFGLELALNSWLVAGILLLAPLVLRQAVREEKKLARALPGYQAYCANTKRFIPFVV